MFEFDPLYKKEKEKWEKDGERKKIIYLLIYLLIYLSIFFLLFFWFCMAALLACMRIRMGTHG